MHTQKRSERTKLRRRGRPARRGAILVAALVCMLAVSLVVAGILRAVATGQRQLRSQRDQLQAALLAESGIDRAAAALRASADYVGESWRIPATDLDGAHEGLVVIRVETSDQASGRRLVSVQADYPADSLHRVRISKQVTVDL